MGILCTQNKFTFNMSLEKEICILYNLVPIPKNLSTMRQIWKLNTITELRTAGLTSQSQIKSNLLKPVVSK